MLSCSKCGRDSGLSGTVSGYWTCGPCVDKMRIEDRCNRLLRTMQAREAIQRGERQAVLVPGKRLPADTTDEAAQAYADEHYGIEWERRSNGIIIWCEM
jgi:hypothetical protein